MSRWRVRLVFALTVTGVAVFLGYRRGEAAAGDAMAAAGLAVRSAEGTRGRSGSDPHLTGGTGRADLAAARQRLRLVLCTSAETAQFWAVIRDFTVEQVQAALAEIPTPPDTHAASVQRGMLLFRWAQLDPQSAAVAATQRGSDADSDTRYVLAAWMKRDADAAVAWASSSAPPDLRCQAELLAARLWAAAPDPAAALKRAKALGPQAVDKLVRELAHRMNRTADGREKFLAMTAELSPESQVIARDLATGVWTCLQPTEALASISASSLPDGEKEAARESAFSHWQALDPGGALDWMADPRNRISPDRRSESYAAWAARAPGAAAQWLSGNTDPAFVAQAVQHSIGTLFSDPMLLNVDFTDSYSQSAQDAYQVWRKAQPAEALAWKNSLPAALQAVLAPADDDAR